jgi:hypothetical protein
MFACAVGSADVEEPGLSTKSRIEPVLFGSRASVFA